MPDGRSPLFFIGALTKALLFGTIWVAFSSSPPGDGIFLREVIYA